MIRVGIIGCGRIADLHAPGYEGRENGRIYAVCDANADTAESRRVQWRAEKAYTNYKDLLADPAVDAVEILTPQHLHEPMVLAALAAGKHVAVQKPMTTTLASARRMTEAGRRAGRVFKVTENYVFYPPIVEARRMIEDGLIGDVRMLRIKYMGASSGGWEVPAGAWEWRMKETAAGRGLATFDHGHHLWSTAWYLFGPALTISGWIESTDGLVDCPALFSIKFKTPSRLGVVEFTHGHEMEIQSNYYANDEWIEIGGEKGMILIRRCTGLMQTGPVILHYDGRRFHEHNVPSDWFLGFKGATNNFLASIENTAPPMLSGEEGGEILRMALASQRAARLGRAVDLDEESSVWRAGYRMRKGVLRAAVSLYKALPLGGGDAVYAPQARKLTEQVVARFKKDVAGDWETRIGLILTAQGSSPALELGLSVKDGTAALTDGLPEDPLLSLWIPAGTWAAICLGKRRIETALLQGKIKFQGRAEEGLKLRSVFGI